MNILTCLLFFVFLFFPIIFYYDKKKNKQYEIETFGVEFALKEYRKLEAKIFDEKNI